MARILWAEDSPHDRMFIQALLGQMPGRPITEFVTDGEELLERLDQVRPDLVVLDVGLAKVSGLEVLSLLKGRPGAPPVLVFGGSESPATIAACLRMGAARYLVKSGDFRQFRLSVQDIAETAQQMGTPPPAVLQVPA